MKILLNSRTRDLRLGDCQRSPRRAPGRASKSPKTSLVKKYGKHDISRHCGTTVSRHCGFVARFAHQCSVCHWRGKVVCRATNGLQIGPQIGLRLAYRLARGGQSNIQTSGAVLSFRLCASIRVPIAIQFSRCCGTMPTFCARCRLSQDEVDVPQTWCQNYCGSCEGILFTAFAVQKDAGSRRRACKVWRYKAHRFWPCAGRPKSASETNFKTIS